MAEKPVDAFLSDLDARYRDEPPEAVNGVSIGPFGVFNLVPPPNGGLPLNDSPLSVTELQAMEVFQSEDAMPSVESVGSLADLHGFLDWPDLFDLDFTSYDIPQPTSDNDFQDTFPGYVPTVSHVAQTDNVEAEGDYGHNSIMTDSLNFMQNNGRVSHAGIDPAKAELALAHFKNHFIFHLRIMPIEKRSPWEVNNLNSAIMTLARITYMTSQPVSHGALANLQAVLALSAHHLCTQNVSHGTVSAEDWQSFSARMSERAMENLQSSLRNETRGPNAAKYKDQLMAILAMLTYATLHDRQQEARAYMIDAERLLRIRGLAKRTISRKARELHHVYTWIRIMEESTFVLHNYEITGTKVAAGSTKQPAREFRNDGTLGTRPLGMYNTGPNPRLDDFLRLNTPPSDSETDAIATKDVETGQHDIHLEDSREFPPSMYTELYGISETWLSLVSQTTRLANVIDRLGVDNERDNLQAMELLERRKQRLENMVCSYTAIDRYDATGQAQSEISRPSTEIARDSIVRALNSALVIFFYRRIRRLNPWILQEHVRNVVQALKDYDTSCRDANIWGTGSPWPAFMAGCEALHPSHREYLSNWFDKAFDITGFERLKAAKACMEDIWRRRCQPTPGVARKDRHQLWTWEHASREQNMHFLLS
ncbi:hypothetical protein LTS17_012217 [Exophiala oligosperma]